MLYLCDFERIGRNHAVPPLEIEATDADELAFHVYTYSRRFLASHDIVVSVDLEEGRGFINAGRFGRFSVTGVEA